MPQLHGGIPELPVQDPEETLLLPLDFDSVPIAIVNCEPSIKVGGFGVVGHPKAPHTDDAHIAVDGHGHRDE